MLKERAPLSQLKHLTVNYFAYLRKVLEIAVSGQAADVNGLKYKRFIIKCLCSSFDIMNIDLSPVKI